MQISHVRFVKHFNAYISGRYFYYWYVSPKIELINGRGCDENNENDAFKSYVNFTLIKYWLSNWQFQAIFIPLDFLIAEMWYTCCFRWYQCARYSAINVVAVHLTPGASWYQAMKISCWPGSVNAKLFLKKGSTTLGTIYVDMLTLLWFTEWHIFERRYPMVAFIIWWQASKGSRTVLILFLWFQRRFVWYQNTATFFDTFIHYLQLGNVFTSAG